jgi:flavin reductase (DIM6/NTAB) family NADH-FMN oxidoreductase RutF
MKEEVKLSAAKWLLEPGCVVLVSSGTMKQHNVMTFSWQTPVNNADPCLILLAINKVRYSYVLIKQNRELVINVPGEDLLEQTHSAGALTGRGVDKFARCGLTPAPARRLAPPIVEECAAHLECRVSQAFEMETHDLLICEVVYAAADTEFFDGKWRPEKFHTLHYLGGRTYGMLGRSVEARV